MINSHLAFFFDRGIFLMKRFLRWKVIAVAVTAVATMSIIIGPASSFSSALRDDPVPASEIRVAEEKVSATSLSAVGTPVFTSEEIPAATSTSAVPVTPVVPTTTPPSVKSSPGTAKAAYSEPTTTTTHPDVEIGTACVITRTSSVGCD